MEKKQNAERNNKGGRPPKSTTDKLKYRVTVKLATPDYYTLKSRARSAGISASEYLRECFRKGYVRQRLTAEHSDYIRKLCGMANNLNQLAKKANEAGFKLVEWSLKGLSKEIKTLYTRLSYDWRHN